jgi:predicted small secreted protein
MRFLATLLLLAACTTTSGAADDLRTAGLTLTDAGEVEQPFLTAKGRVYAVEGGDLQLYTYASEAAAQQDAAKISPSGEIEGVQVSWMAQPHFYRRGNVLAIYVGFEPKTLEALQRVLGAPIAEKP